MKFIKTYKMFETFWSMGEYVNSITRELSNWDIEPSYLRKIIDQFEEEIKLSWGDGKSPKAVAEDIAKFMELPKDGNFPGIKLQGQKPVTTIKYL
jgi:hypothetical protein